MKNLSVKIVLSLLLLTCLSWSLSVENLQEDVLKAVSAKRMEKQEYLVTTNPKLGALKKSLETNLGTMESSIDQNTNTVRLFKNRTVGKDLKDVLSKYPTSPSQLVEACKLRAKKDLAALGADGELEAVDVEYTENAIVGSRVSKVMVRYKRKFRGSLVRDNLSYAYAIYDGDGTPSGAEVRWPEFTAAPGPVDEETTTPAESYTYLTTQLGKAMKEEGSTRKINAVSAKVGGFESAWMPIEVDGRLILTPVYSYQSQVELDDGNKITRLVDYPVLRKRLK